MLKSFKRIIEVALGVTLAMGGISALLMNKKVNKWYTKKMTKMMTDNMDL